MNAHQNNINVTLKQFRDKLDEVHGLLYALSKELPVTRTVIDAYMTPLFDLHTDLEFSLENHNERTN